MTDDQKSDFEWLRLAAYLSGTSSPEDRAWLERWLDADPARHEELERLRAAWTDTHATPVPKVDPHAMWSAIADATGITAMPSPNGVTSSTTTKPVATSATRRTVAGRGMPVRWISALVATAAIAIAAYTTRTWNTTAPGAQRVYATGRGERATVRLPDGSTITLGAQSKLRYAAPFGRRNRDVYLDGEAYFTISHQSNTPFVVYTEHSATQVLGTAFLVKAYAHDPDVQVVVSEGKIALRPANAEAGSGITLTRGDMARMTTAGLMSITRDVAIDPYVSWTHGQLIFKRVTIGELIPDLERWYDVKIVLADPAFASSAVTLTLDTESVDQALSLLSSVSNLSWTRHGTAVTVSTRR